MILSVINRIFISLTVTAGCIAQPSSTPVYRFDNDYLTIEVLRGWKTESVKEQVVTLRHGKYLLEINPIFLHASPVEGGRFDELLGNKPSVNAVMQNIDRPAGGFECSEPKAKPTIVTKDMSLANLYTDSARTNYGCVFPRRGRSVWFGSAISGKASESDYVITLTYDSMDVNELPAEGSPELRKVFADVVRMLKSLHMKPPIVISRIEPVTASPGETVTIYGSGFHVLNHNVDVRFDEFLNNPLPTPNIAPDGKSLTFRVPTSDDKFSCPTGKVDLDGCVPTPANHVNVNDCPATLRRATTFCGVPILPHNYQISLVQDVLSSNSVTLTLKEDKPRAVTISLLYPNAYVLQDDEIVIRGSGFTSTDNTVEIGSAKVRNLSSPDGHTITFPAPAPEGTSFVSGLRVYEASVSNANGKSNVITFRYE
ncbi:MAG TPA: IPT/TIG domain-containing protein [Terriglobales bacterium]|jgi:hypothetical protein